ncbi:MAG: hypothetical protein AAGF32_09385 [Pseudomonadota bacterium]
MSGTLDVGIIGAGVAGLAAAKALLVSLLGAMAIAVVAAALFAAFDAESYEVIFDLTDGGLTSGALVSFAVVMAVLALSAMLPFLPWTVAASEAPAALAALLQIVVPAVGVFILLRLAPVYDGSLIWGSIGVWLALITGLVGVTSSLAQTDLGRAVGASALAPVGMAVAVALAGNPALGMIVIGVQALSGTLLWISYGAVIRGLDFEADIKKLGGLRKILFGPHVAALLATLVSTGFGSAVLVAGVPAALPGFISQASVLSTFADQSSALLWVGFGLLALHALALWRLYFRVFLGTPRGKKAKSATEPLVVTAPGRAVLAILSLLALAGTPFLVAAFQDTLAPNTGSVAVMLPTAAFLFGLVLGYALFLGLPSFGSSTEKVFRPVSQLARDFWGIKAAVDYGIERPGKFIGEAVMPRLDRALFEGVFARPASWLLPLLQRRAGQAQQSRAFPFVLGTVVAGALTVTLVTMAGG